MGQKVMNNTDPKKIQRLIECLTDDDDIDAIASNLNETGIDIDGLCAKVQALVDSEKKRKNNE